MRVFSRIVMVAGSAMLAFFLFALGYYACSHPLSTEILSQGTSDYENSPYSLDDLNSLACASRDYTVEPRADASTAEDARIQFNETLMEAAASSATHYLNYNSASTEDASSDNSLVDKKALWNELMAGIKQTRPADAFDKTGADANALASQMASISEIYALGDEAFSHLDDCNKLINAIVPFTRMAGIGALACLLILLVCRQWRQLARMLSVAPLILLLAFAFMGTWAIIDFRSFFSAFHGIFFPQGNWTFSSDSLLICMYPTAFWMGMGALWLVTTALASVVVLIIGRHVSEHADRKGQ